MAQYDVVVKAVDQTKSTFKGIESGLKGIESMASRVQNVLAGLITAQAVKSFVQAGQELQTIERRLAALSPAGTDVRALFNSLVGLSSQLGANTGDLANAYLILRNNGIQPSIDSLTTLNNIAKVSGGNIASIADAIGNVADGERLKALENATNGLIKIDDVLNQYGASTGQFAVKYQGQTVAIVKTTQEALNAINQIGSVNLSGPAQQTDTLGKAWERFKTAIAGAAKALLEGGLEAGLIRLVNSATLLVIKWTPLIQNLGPELANAIVIGARAVDFLANSFNVLKVAVLTYLGVQTAGAIIGLSTLLGQKALAARNAALGMTALAASTTAAAGAMGLLATASAFLTKAMPWLNALSLLTLTLGALWSVFGKDGTKATDDNAEAMKRLNEETARQKKLIEEAMGANQQAINAGLPQTGALKAPTSKPLAPNVLNALQQLQKQTFDAEQAIKVLEPALMRALNTGNLIEYNRIFEALKSNYETVGRTVLPDFGMAAKTAFNDLNKSIGEDVQKLGILEANLQKVTDTFGAGSPIVSQYKDQIDELRKKFDPYAQSVKTAEDRQRALNVELYNSAIALTAEAEKLGNATYQQGIFNQNVVKNAQALEQQRITLGLLNDAYATGVIGLSEYADSLGQINERLLGSNELLAKYSSSSQDEVNLTNKKKKSLDQLIENYRAAGGAGTEAFRKTAEALGANATRIDLIVAQYGSFADQVKERNDAIKNSIFDASKTFVNEFTQAFIQGKNVLSSFKNFFTNVLNDIAAQLIQQQISKPIASLLSNFIGSLIPGLATGGIAQSNQAYVVGEKGPELFVPGRTGSVIPNDALSSTMAAQDGTGGALTVNFTINAVDTQTGVQFLLQNKPVITSMISDAYNRRGRRGPLD